MKKLQDHNSTYLRKKLVEAGVLERACMMTLVNWERAGKLKLRRKPHNNFRTVNDKEVSEIIRSFSPGGKGYWHWDKLRDKIVDLK